MENKMNILEPNLADVIISVRSTNLPNLVQIGREMVPPCAVKRWYIGLRVFFPLEILNIQVLDEKYLQLYTCY